MIIMYLTWLMTVVMFQKSYGLISKLKEKIHLEFPYRSMMVQYTVTAWLKRTFLTNTLLQYLQKKTAQSYQHMIPNS